MENLYQDNDIVVINDFYEKLKNCNDKNEFLNIISDLYKFVKKISPKYYINGNMIDTYGKIRDILIKCEDLIPTESITSIKPDFSYNNIYNKRPSNNDDESILKWLVNTTRQFLVTNNSYNSKNPTPLENIDMTSNCYVASKKIHKLCKKIGIKSKIVKIYPGFDKKANLYNGYGYHYVVVTNINNKNYLVDCTYSQFFNLYRNNLDRLGIVGLSGCNVGIFMMIDEKRKKVAEQVLKKGYIELNDENMKAYFDGFALSYRNGLYYKNTNDYSYQTEYTAEDYKRFLDGEDSQLNYESRDTLGSQKKFA